MKKFLLAAIVVFAFMISGCNDNKIQSTWRTNNIKIDGNEADWGKSLIYVKDSNLLFGVQNDDKYLYLCMVTNNQELQSKILHLGLTVWFDSTGGDDKNFGIKYPLSFKDLNQGNFDLTKNEDGNPMSGRSSMNQVNMNERMLMRQTDVEILGKNPNDYTRIGLSELKGIKLKISIKDYRFVYEMKIPLAQYNNTSYALNTDTSRTIGIGLETGTIDRNKFAQKKDNGFEGNSAENPGDEAGNEGDEFGGGYGSRMHRRNGYDRQEGQRQSLMSDPLNYWVTVKLASGK